MKEKTPEEELSEYLQWLYFEDNCEFTDKESCNKWKKRNEGLVLEDKPEFSFMMAVYNDMTLFNSAVSSLLKQNFTNWELVILDNSDKNDSAWETIQNAVQMDSRIRAYKENKNVGWAKGASILLNHVRGTYVTFLAADDCINMGSLERLHEIALAEEPDVIWVGYMYVDFLASHIRYLSGNCPQYKVYGEENRSDAIVDIMNRVYYNSFFHYMRVDFLKQHNIDFYEPYYADCAGMTKCMTASRKMVVADAMVYCLTRNTSQTVGHYIWDAYDFMFANQWRCVREVFHKEKYLDSNGITYVANRILNNLYGNISALCCGRCRDKYMNSSKKTKKEIIDQLEAIMLCDDIAEMIYICGSSFGTLLSAISNLSSLGIEENDSLVMQSRLRPLLILGIAGNRLNMEEKAGLMAQWLLSEINTWCTGFDYYASLLETLDDMVLAKFRQDIDNIVLKYDSI